MNLDSGLFASQGVIVVRGIVAEFQHIVGQLLLNNIAGNGSALVHLVPALIDDVPGRPNRFAKSTRVQANHIGAEGFQDLQIARLGMFGFGEPPNMLDGILHPDAPHCHPFRGSRHFSGIVPVALLGQVEADLLNQRDEKFILVK